MGPDGKTYDHFFKTVIIFSLIIHIQTYKMFIELKHWNSANLVGNILSIIFYYSTTYILSVPLMSQKFDSNLLERIFLSSTYFKTYIMFALFPFIVLLPDIAYVLNKPGYSALQCVLSAVDQAVKTSSIDEQNIGLIGHSFGGFETSYIVGQTNRFKTAVAGAGVTDLLSFYLDIDSSDISNMERFENSQFRNRIAFTENEFLSESPIMNVKGINTPLLIWTGDNDKMVKSSYAIKMFAALWRLQKKSTLLIYPDEPHVIVNPVNQRDLTLKLTQWFDYQLKNSPKEDWMND